jgi:hypothetical protein
MVTLITRTSGWIDVGLTVGWLLTVVVVAARWIGREAE